MKVSKRIVAAILILLVCALTAAGLLLRPSLFRTFGSQEEPLARQLDEAIGATVEPLDSGTARGLGLAPQTHGLVVTSVASGGPAARAGVRTGDVVVAIDRPVGSMKDFATGIQRDGNALTITLNRHGQSVILPLTPGSLTQRTVLLEEQEWR